MGVIDIQRSGADKVLAYDHELEHLSKRKIKYVTEPKSSKKKVQKRSSRFISNICVGPSCFDFMDDILLFSMFRHAPVYNDRGYKYGATEQVKVKVMSTIISRETCELDEEGNSFDLVVEKKLRESIFVGQLHRASKFCPLKAGTSVTSLRRCPVQSRFVTLAPDALIPIPEKLDIGEAAATVSTFVPAMGLLHHGRLHRSRRFSSSSLKGLDILVTGGGTDEADAVINLALLGGADRIFVSQSKCSLATVHARSVRVELISDDPKEWKHIIHRYVDLIVDLEYPKNFESLYGTLKSTGRLVCRKPTGRGGWLAPIMDAANDFSLLNYPNASMYDIDEQIEYEHGDLVRDVRFLFELLQDRKIRPKVDRYVTLQDVERIRKRMRTHPGSGAVVCEPWREYTDQVLV